MRYCSRLGWMLLAALFSGSTYAIDPATWSSYDTEQLTVVVTIPVPDNPQTVTLNPLLIKPAVPPPWKSVVMPSNSTGLDDQMWRRWVPELIKNNIAVVLLDSLNPRGFSDVLATQAVPLAARLQDAHQTLDFVRNDSRFVGDKVAIVGHSIGANSAFNSAYVAAGEKFGRPADKPGFNAYVGASTSCEAIYKSALLRGPILLISGSKDDYTRPEPCQKEIERLKKADQPAEMVLIDGVNHSFSAYGKYYPSLLHAPADFPTVFTYKLSYTNPRETEIEFEDGQVMSLNQAYRKYAGFLGSKVYGANAGGNWEKAAEVVQLTLDFLKKYGW